MKKVGIVTITSGANYGNRLQNYAMQTTLKKLGYSPYTIRKLDEKTTIKDIIKKCIKHITKYKYTPLDKRIERFEAFNKKYMIFSKNHIESDDYSEKLCNGFDGFICGSDQIWNPNYKMNTGSHFLSFVKGKKKISVAASIGIAEIKEEDAERIGVWMRELDAISVRESAAKKICEDITDKDVSVLIDPTLTLNADEWRQISEKPRNIGEGKYIFCYLLGKQSENFINELKTYSEKTGRQLVFLEDIWRKLGVASDDEYCYGPSEFIWLIEHSDMVVTDSFHATVFSIIFKKKFWVVPRDDGENNMNSRFSSLFDMLSIENGEYSKDQGFEADLVLDYEKIGLVLDKERNKFYEFIKVNL